MYASIHQLTSSNIGDFRFPRLSHHSSHSVPFAGHYMFCSREFYELCLDAVFLPLETLHRLMFFCVKPQITRWPKAMSLLNSVFQIMSDIMTDAAFSLRFTSN